jgi:uncharacterized protein (TIGR03435 family)
MTRFVLVAALGAAVCFSQTTPPPQAFEVAAIKPSKAADQSSHSNWSNGRITMENLSVQQIIEEAYGIKYYQLAGAPGWVEAERYNIQAKAEEKVETAQLRIMLQALLAERFHLTVRHEKKSMTAYALVTAKGGLKVNPVEGSGSSMNHNNGKLTASHTDMARLADFLARRLDRPVVDETGIAGYFDFKLEWAPERGQQRPEGDGGAGPTIFTALTEQLGLRLETRKVPVDILVVDRIERPSDN